MTAITQALRGQLTEGQCWNTGTHAVLVTESMPHVHAPGADELRAEARRLRAWRRNDDGTCRHGVYVGGVGIDWMCGQCEQRGADEEASELEKLAEEVQR